MARSANRKTPQLSFEATVALDKASEPFFAIELAIERLEELDLTAFSAECRRRGNDGHQELYAALAGLADAERTKLEARRSPDGVWYACLDVIRWEPNQHTGQGIASYCERCEGRASAVDAARRLLVKHAAEFTDETTVDARVLTAIEWLAENADRAVGAI